MFDTFMAIFSSSYVKWGGAVAVFLLPPDGFVLTMETFWFVLHRKIRNFEKKRRANSSSEKPPDEKFANTGETNREKNRSKPIPISGEGAPPSPPAADAATTSLGGVESTPSANATEGGQAPQPPVASITMRTAVTPTTAQISNGAAITSGIGVTAVLIFSRVVSRLLNNSMADTEK